jgi:hypothetical protein
VIQSYGVAGNLGFDKLVKERYISIDVLLFGIPDTHSPGFCRIGSRVIGLHSYSFAHFSEEHPRRSRHEE